MVRILRGKKIRYATTEHITPYLGEIRYGTCELD
jgi:hypothetical protein